MREKDSYFLNAGGGPVFQNFFGLELLNEGFDNAGGGVGVDGGRVVGQVAANGGDDEVEGGPVGGVNGGGAGAEGFGEAGIVEGGAAGTGI